jgi:MAP/microtubule affinity-regulating kinase
MQYDAFGFAIRQKKTSPTRGAFADSELIAGLPPSSSSTSLYQPLDTLSAAPSLSRHAVPRSFIAPASSSSHLFSSSSGLSIATTASTSTRKTSPEGSLRSPKSAASSPAAHFLSSFGSPFAAPAAPAPDTAGQPVPGHPDLTLGALLGTSTDTVVRLASSASGAPSVAVKIVKLPAAGAPHARRTRTRIARERALWAGLAHEHVLPLFGATLTDTRAWFVTLPCGAGSLADLLRAAPRGLPPALAGPLGRQTAKGLRYLHERGLVHRDVKLENVLVDDAGQARLADFGLAVHAAAKGGPPAPESDDSDSDSERDERAPAPAPVTVTVPPPGVAGRPGGMVRRQSTFNAYPSILSMRADIATSAAPGRASRRGSLSLSQPPPRRRHVPGSLPYAAPELFAAAPAPPAPAQDVWALGCVLHALACGELPFADPFEPRLVVKIQHGQYTHVFSLRRDGS